uniref:Uncharacterized protein n=1 Tax=Salix viminalis TaxID=40686 RepID=A0A6N2M611_SALVM
MHHKYSDSDCAKRFLSAVALVSLTKKLRLLSSRDSYHSLSFSSLTRNSCINGLHFNSWNSVPIPWKSFNIHKMSQTECNSFLSPS